MINLKNKLILTSVTAFFVATLSLNAYAASFVSNDSENLTQCSRLVKSQVGDVSRMKTAKIKSKSRFFTVNYNINDNGERSVVRCKLARGKDAEVSCLKGNLCGEMQAAATPK